MSHTEAPDFDRLSEAREIAHEVRELRDELKRAWEERDQYLQSNKRLFAAVQDMLIAGNHIATYRRSNWPDYPLDGLTRAQQCEHALRVLGAGLTYDVWCCWSGIMQARDALAPTEREMK